MRTRLCTKRSRMGICSSSHARGSLPSARLLSSTASTIVRGSRKSARRAAVLPSITCECTRPWRCVSVTSPAAKVNRPRRSSSRSMQGTRTMSALSLRASPASMRGFRSGELRDETLFELLLELRDELGAEGAGLWRPVFGLLLAAFIARRAVHGAFRIAHFIGDLLENLALRAGLRCRTDNDAEAPDLGHDPSLIVYVSRKPRGSLLLLKMAHPDIALLQPFQQIESQSVG